MKRRIAFLFLGLCSVVPSFAATANKLQVSTTTTEHFHFAPGGVIRMEGAYGYVNVEGWDLPEIEISITKSTPDFDVKNQAHGRLALDRTRTITERRSESELVISTIPPVTTSLINSITKRHQGGVMLDYEIRVPRVSTLVIQHGKGLVSINGVTGDINVASSRGDIILMLPGQGPYSIDATCRIGTTVSDFDGDTHRKVLVGEHFVSQAEGRRIHLRMGVGSIEIKAIPPEAQALGKASAQ